MTRACLLPDRQVPAATGRQHAKRLGADPGRTRPPQLTTRALGQRGVSLRRARETLRIRLAEEALVALLERGAGLGRPSLQPPEACARYRSSGSRA